MATLGSLGGGAGGLPGTGENIGSNITVTEPTSTSRSNLILSCLNHKNFIFRCILKQK